MIRRATKYTSLFLFGLLLALLIFIGATNIGLRFILDFLPDVLPGHLKYELSSGALNRNIHFKSIDYEINGSRFQANNINLKLQPLALIFNDLKLQYLNIQQFHITIATDKKPSPKTNTTEPPSLMMPLKFLFNNLSIEHLIYQSNGDKTIVKQIHFEGALRPNKLEINSLSANYAQKIYQANAFVNLKPLELHLHVSQQANLDVGIDGKGSWQHIVLHSELKAPVVVKSTITLDNILQNPQWIVDGKVKSLNLEQYQKHALDTDLSGTFHGSGNSSKFDFNAKLVPQDINNSNTHIDFHADSKNLKAQQFLISLQWGNLFWPNMKSPIIASQQGDIHINGTLNNYKILSKIQIAGRNIPTSTLNIQGNGSKKQLNFTQLDAYTLQGHINGSGHIDFSPKLNYLFNFDAANLHPDSEWNHWPGSVSFLSELHGDAQNVQFILNNLSGKIRGEALTGSIEASVKDTKLHQANISLFLGKANLHFSLVNKRYMDAKWNVNIPDLEDSIPFATGEIHSQGEFKRLKTAPVITGNLHLRNFSYSTYGAAALDTDFDISLSAAEKQRPSIFNFHSTNLTINHYILDELDVTSRGRNPHHLISILAKSGSQTLHSNIEANVAKNDIRATVKRMDLSSAETGTWRLRRAFNVYWQNQKMGLEHFSWHSQRQDINLDVRLDNKRLKNSKIEIKNFNLRTLNIFLPQTLRNTGTLNFGFDYNDKDNSIQATMNGDLKNVVAHYTVKNKAEKTTLRNAKLNATLKNKDLTSSLILNYQKPSFLQLKLNASDFDPYNMSNKDTHYEGSLKSYLVLTSFISAIFPGIDSVTGVVKTNLSWNGTLIRPNLLGKASISNANLFIPNSGINIKNFSLNLEAIENEIKYQAQAQSGKGSLNINASTQFGKHYKTEVAVKGKNFLIDNTPQFGIVISPDLNLKIVHKNIELSGVLEIPQAEINLQNYNDVVTLPGDVVIQDSNTIEDQYSFFKYFHAKILLKLGNKINLKTSMLDANLSGQVILVDEPNTVTKADGELTITKGTFSIFGNSLNIENGKLFYAGNDTSNPALNVRATKTIKTFVSPSENTIVNNTLSTGDAKAASNIAMPLQQKNILVGVNVTGRLSHPKLLLFSDQPNLSQSDILSYLLLGYPLSNASSKEGEALLQALTALSADRNEVTGLLTTIKSTLDLNQIGFQSSNFLNPSNNQVEQNTSLVLGKMLSPKLMVRYSIGLLIPINTLSASYNFTNNWSLQTETNSIGNGVDLIYSFEHN